MGGTPFSQEVFNTREEFVSSDANRLQSLASRDVQDALAASSRSLDTAAAVPGSFDLLRANGTPISGLDLAPTFIPSAGLTATVGAGSGYSYFPAGVTADYSTYQVLRWPSQTVTFTGGAGNPRIDIVYAAIGSVVSQTASRNILVDPVARTVAAQSVNKQVDPLSTLGVWAGTAAANPAPDRSGLAAAHPGAIPLFYVWVPAGAGASTQFGVTRGAWRRAAYPFSALNGLVSQAALKWDLAAVIASDSALSWSGTGRVLIDGEMLEWNGNVSSANGGVIQDSGANPFSVAAPATWGKIYYIYAVGGRNNPAFAFDSGSGTLAPIVLVESLTPPDLATGRPQSALTLPSPWGYSVQAGATYVGLGMVNANSTHRGACIMDDVSTYFSGGVAAANTVFVVRTGASADPFSTPPTAAQINFPTVASIGVAPILVGSTPGFYTIHPDTGAGAVSPQFTPNYGLSYAFASSVGTAPGGVTRAEVPWPGLNQGALWLRGGTTGDTVNLTVFGYRHRVRTLLA